MGKRLFSKLKRGDSKRDDAKRDEQDLKACREQATHAASFILDRALAHLKQPSKYPLPQDTHSLEHAFVNRLKLLPSDVAETLSSQAIGRLTAPVTQRTSRYGAIFANHDATKASEPVEHTLSKKREQLPTAQAAQRLRERFNQPEFKSFTPEFLSRAADSAKASATADSAKTSAKADSSKTSAKADSAKASAKAHRIAGADKLDSPPDLEFIPTSVDLRLLNVTCHKTTRGIIQDKIQLAANVHDVFGRKSATRDAFKLAWFKDGEEYNDEQSLVDLTIDDASSRIFIATVYMAEKDLGGGLTRYVEKFGALASTEFYELAIGAVLALTALIVGPFVGFSPIRDLVGLAIYAAGTLGGVLLGVFGLPLAFILDEAIIAILPLLGIVLFDGFRALFRSEIFPPQIAVLHIDGDDLQGTAPQRLAAQTLTFTLEQDVWFKALTVQHSDGSVITTEDELANKKSDQTSHYSAQVEWLVEKRVGLAEPVFPGQLAATQEEGEQRLLDKIEHIIVVMLENRSFDHMLGFLSRGQLTSEYDPAPGVIKANACTAAPVGESLVPNQYADTHQILDPGHNVNSVATQIWGQKVWEDFKVDNKINDEDGLEFLDQLKALPGTPATMSGFVDNYAQRINGYRNRLAQFDLGGPFTADEEVNGIVVPIGKDGVLSERDRQDLQEIMNNHPAQHVPIFDMLATEFGVCTKWFSAFPGNTWVNRTIAYTGFPAKDKDGRTYIDNKKPIDEDSFLRILNEYKVEWGWYFQDFPSIYMVDGRLAASRHNRRRAKPIKRFMKDLENGDLPQVCWLDPNFVDLGNLGHDARAAIQALSEAENIGETVSDANSANDDHPPTDISHGQNFLFEVFWALFNSKYWNNSMMIITYDEHGGFYDHVPPERLTEQQMAGMTEQERAVFGWRGARVPALVVSPFVGRSVVSDQVFDHLSIMKTILLKFARFEDEPDKPIPYPNARVEFADSLGRLLGESQPRFAQPETFSAPRSTATGSRDNTQQAAQSAKTAQSTKTGKDAQSAKPSKQLAHAGAHEGVNPAATAITVGAPSKVDRKKFESLANTLRHAYKARSLSDQAWKRGRKIELTEFQEELIGRAVARAAELKAARPEEPEEPEGPEGPERPERPNRQR